MTAASTTASEDELVAKISDYLDGTLPPPERTEVANKITSDAEWKRVHEELVETRKMISGMQKARAPESFAQEVTETIHKRSAGRFFGRRTFGDRVPFGVLLVVALVVLVAIAGVMWSSQTGSLKREHEPPAPRGSAIVAPP
jgi:anti-sigma factor RsiW